MPRCQLAHDPRHPRSYDLTVEHPFCRRLVAAGHTVANNDRDPWSWATRRRLRGRAVLGDLYHRPVPRSERREAIGLVLQYLGRHVQVSTLRIVRFGGGGVSIRSVVRGTGLTRDRVTGALADLRTAGYLGGYQPRDAGTRGRPSIRWLTLKAIKWLGLWRSFCALRRYLGLSEPIEPSPPIRATVGTLARAVAVVPDPRDSWPSS